MSSLDAAIDVADVDSSNLWVIYGKSQSGKTEFLSTLPKPILLILIGDDGTRTLKNKKGMKILRAETPSDIKTYLRDAMKDKKYASVAVDTFSLAVNVWIETHAIAKGKKMTMQMWGDLGADMNEIIKAAHILSAKKVVALTCHELADSIEGYEDEIVPDIRPNMNRFSRTYLEGMANYGIHTTVVEKEKDDKTLNVFMAHVSPNPYYWAKIQKPKEVKMPKMMANPTYPKIMKKVSGE